MRKRSRRSQPLCFISTTHHASTAVACESSSSSLFCFPFFYVLLITWIVLFTLNQTLSHIAGSSSWSAPGLSGVHADGSNGEQNVISNDLRSYTEEILVPSSESIPFNDTPVASKSKSKSIGRLSVQDLKCRHPSFREVLRLSTVPGCLSRSSSLTGSNVDCKAGCMHTGAATRRVAPLANKGSGEYQELQDSSNGEEPLSHKGESNVDMDGVVNDPKKMTRSDVEEQGTHLHMDDDKKRQNAQHIEYELEHLEKDGCDHHNDDSVDNDIQYQTPTTLPKEDLPQNESESVVTTSDILNKTHPALTNLSKAHLRQEPGDGLYNYAADSKGAKILASNKEAKGAANILNKDKDKYFRTPCNVETKFVDMELSEETLVVQLVIANHEFYSSNVKELELWGSLTYPAEEWLLLGKFEAENSRVPQTFALREPQWVRYLKLQMLSHFGSDFYCTLSMVEVYGVDAIESFLEDWIAEELGGLGAQNLPSKEENSSAGTKSGSSMHPQSHPIEKDADPQDDVELMLTEKLEDTFTDVSEGKGRNAEKPQSSHHQTGRLAFDAVMKLLMQKVRSLEHKEPLWAQQLKELNEKCNEASSTHIREQLTMTGNLETLVTEIANLSSLLQSMERNWDQERVSLQRDLVKQVETWKTDLFFLRSKLRWTENKELVALAVSFFSIITVVGIQVLMLCISVLKPEKHTEKPLLDCGRMLWAVPFLSCTLVMFVLSL